MIDEVADIRVAPEQSADFEKAIVHGVNTVIAQAKGFLGYQIKRSLESPGRYLLVVRWQTLENHTQDFRGSEAFAQWRSIVGPFFASPPLVEHFEVVAGETGFA